MSVYEAVVAIHVVTVIITLGVTFLYGPLQVAAERAPRHLPFVLRVMRDAERKMVWPGIAIIFVTGVFLMLDDRWRDRGDTMWLQVSIALFVFAALVSLTVLRRANDVALAEIELAERAAGPDSEIVISSECKRALGVMSRTGPLLGIITIVIAVLMEAKPF
jgi:uncharacterized membrane protein